MGAYSRQPFIIVSRQKRPSKEVYGAVDDAVVLQAQLLKPDRESDTVMVAMHPMGSAAYLPVFAELARNGNHVIACGSRYWSGDAALQMENVLLDLGACVRDARERFGYKRVILVGWSGGGSVMAGYQAEAEVPRIRTTAAGEETALATTRLAAADGLLLMATHRSRHHLLTGQLDASLVSEIDPGRRDPQLDLYDAANPNQPPYSEDFIAAYRAAQIARNRRITNAVKERLDALTKAGRHDEEHCFVVHGTMADPRWLDPAVDPNERAAGICYLGDPRLVNNSPAGLGRYSSLRSWLSQWSYDDAQIDSVDAGPRITCPSLLIVASADDACPPSHSDAIFAALGSANKTRHDIAGANHYFSGPDGKQHLQQAMDRVTEWLDGAGFVNR